MMEFEARWANRTATPFVEAAEVLDVDTNLIMAAMEKDGLMHVLYSKSSDRAEDIYGVILRRGGDDVLVRDSEPVMVPDLMKKIGELRRLLG